MAMDRKNRPEPKPRPRPKPPAPQPEPPADEHEDQADDVEEDRGPRRSLPNPGGAVREGSWVVLGFLGLGLGRAALHQARAVRGRPGPRREVRQPHTGREVTT
jgi:hypothetical protein